MTELLGDSYCFISPFLVACVADALNLLYLRIRGPAATQATILGVKFKLLVWLTTSFPESLNSSSVERERG